MGKTTKIVLGTAQLGQDYGIANKTGAPSAKTAFKLLDAAIKNGINTFDTAPVYGNSERLIGNYLRRSKNHANLITKIPAFTKTDMNKERYLTFLRNSLNASLKKLKQPRIYGLLFHSYLDFIKFKEQILMFIEDCKKKGLIEIAGISVYSPEEIINTYKLKQLDAFQAPMNVWDQRLLKGNIAERLKKFNKRLFVRSVFLQGLLLLGPKEIKKKMPGAVKHCSRLLSLSAKYKRPVPEIAFCFVRDTVKNGSLVIGAETIGQLMNNIKLSRKPPLPRRLISEIKRSFSNVSEKIINPTKWRQK
jgi:aryl-alcohol dehydrogenase-like predicted oxidoreductase